MPRPGVRAKLFVTAIVAIVVGAAIAYAFVEAALDRALFARMRDALFLRADLVAWQVDQARPASPAAWDALAHDLAAHAHCRVTLVAADGRVLGDSEGEALENQAKQPEIVEARTNGRGSAVRGGVLFVAMPTRAGAARLALPMTYLASAQSQLAPTLVLGLVIAAALATAIARLTGRASRRDAGVESARATPEPDSRAQIDRILSGMQEGVLLLDASGKIVFVNPALRQMLLLGADSVGKAPLEVIQNDELKKLIESAEETGATQSAELEQTGLKPRRLLVRVVPLVGAPGGLLAVFVDVTDIRRLESMRKDFVANASHELRTPVTAVRSAAETLRFAMESDPEAAGHFLDIIERNAERLHMLVEDLLDLSRIESREFRLDMEDEDLGEVVAQVVALFRERAEKKQIRLTADVAPELPRARADRRALEQVLTNLVDNALKYSPERATVVVRAREEQAKRRKLLRVSVVDSGPGIAEKDQPRLFERFYRVDKGRSRELGGTGLGLSIVKHLCDALGGSIHVESRVGKGSTFSFTLLQAGQEKPETSPPPPVVSQSQPPIESAAPTDVERPSD